MLNITKTTKFIAFAFLLAFVVPTTASAFKNDSWGGSYSDSGWDDYSGGSGSSYYYDTPSYDYSYDYTPNYSYDDYSYDSGYYGGNNDYYTPQTPQSYGGYNYSTPSSYYSSPSYTESYSTESVYVPSTPSTSYSVSSSNPVTTSNSAASNETKVTSSNTSTNTNTSANNSSATATGGNAVNNNVNNVYVYTNPTGNAVVHNPEYKKLDGYCVITPSNPRIGQTVTATAYITGGIGSYTYVWGGDLLSTASGVSTSFTSYNAGTKNIIVTARSGQDVRTANCSVTFERENTHVAQPYTYGSYTSSYVPTGTSVSGVYVQPAYINPGKSVSGVYLNDLPATGVDLNWMHYMIAFMVVVLATVTTYVSKNKSRFTGVVDSE